jgi:hypothetical protein
MKMEVPSDKSVILRTFLTPDDIILETDLDGCAQAPRRLDSVELRLLELERCKVYRPQLGPL